MTEKFKPMDRNNEAKKYWEGKENKFIRAWIYTQRGLNEFNEFKYFILAIFSGALMLYAKIPLKWVLIVAVIVIPIALYALIRFGRWHVNKAAKTESWIMSEYSNPLGYKEYNIKVKQLRILKSILKEVRKGR